MHIITTGQDLNISYNIIGGEDFSIDDLQKLDVTVFTTDPNIEPQFHKADIDGDILPIGWDILSDLEAGQISLKFEWSFEDENYSDDTYDTGCVKHLDYYLLKSDVSTNI